MLPEECRVPAVRAGQLALPSGVLGGGRRGIAIGTPRIGSAVERREHLGGTRLEALRVREIRLRRDVLVAAAREERRQGAKEPRRVPERAVLLEVQVEQALAHEHDHLGPRQDPHVRRQPELERELPDQPVPERVERGDGRVGVAVGNELVDPELHLLGGLVRERKGEDLRRLALAASRSATRSGG